MKRAGWPEALALASGLVFAGPVGPVAEAQPPGVQGLKAGWGGVELLAHPLVRSELKLEGSQLEQAKALGSALRERRRGFLAQLEGLDAEGRAGKSRELAAVLAEEESRGLADLLRPEQLARFGQVDLQQRGASAWLDPKVAGPLAITPEQAAKVAGVLDRSMIRRREAQSSTRGDRRATTRKVEAIRKEADAEAVALLTPDQDAAWRGLIGEPLDLNPASPPAR